MRVALAVGLAAGLAACGSVPPRTDADVRRERLLDLNDRAQRAVGRGDLRRAAALYREALRQAEAIEDFPAIAVNALNLAGTHQALGDPAAAQAVLERILVAPARFESSMVADASGRKAFLALQAGELDAAGEWLARAEAECRKPGCRSHVALLNLGGQLALARGAAGQARLIAGRALAASRSEGGREEEANALRLAGRAASSEGEHVEAVALLAQALDLDKQLALPRKIGLDLLALTEAELARGERAAARGYAQRAHDVSRAAGDLVQQEAARRLLERAR